MRNDKRMAKADAGGQQVIDVGQVAEEQLQTVDDGRLISVFLASVAGFFITARDLETSALRTLDTAKQLKQPADPDADVVIRKFIRKTTDDKKQIEAHWGITGVIHRFHRRLTAKRDIGVKALEQANAVGNALHNRYEDERKRREQEEERKRREQAEFLARQEREQELALAEARAAEAEEASPELSARELAFVVGVSEQGYTPIQASKMAGFKDPVSAANRLSLSSKIQAAIKAKQEAAAIRRQAAATAQRPLDVDYQEVESGKAQAPGLGERTTWSAVLTDPEALMEAFLSGKYGIPRSIWVVDMAALNAEARQQKKQLDRWPGCHAKSTTKVI